MVLAIVGLGLSTGGRRIEEGLLSGCCLLPLGTELDFDKDSIFLGAFCETDCEDTLDMFNMGWIFRERVVG
jgi:hypothetical protein